ncbi:ATP-binding protein [Thiohalocapsa sp. ML1]|uniref:ATP-binding protein n=1 Tax=Thiohalocapsa sp. ML1 TaxID=1431688 RepID=UPI000731FC1B|nr:ATP-binding protein [Thiohalocapsa sp. ML1]
MSNPTTTNAWVGTLVRHGLATFAADVLDAADPLPAALRAEAAGLGAAGLPTAWPDLLEVLADAWPLTEGRLGALIADLDLDPPQVFVLGLAGVVETSHLVGLMLARLQAPAVQARPTLHLTAALAGALFGADAGALSGLLAHPLLRAGVLRLEGEGPQPLAALRLPPPFWAVLSGDEAPWPGCTRLPLAGAALLPQRLTNDLPKLAALLGSGSGADGGAGGGADPTPGGVDATGLVLRGTPGSGRSAVAAALAARLGRTALAVPLALWEQEPALALACRYAGWLPVLRPTLRPGELWSVPGHADLPTPVVVLVGIDGAVAGAGLVELDLPPLPEPERRALWTARLGDAAVGAVAAHALLAGPVIDGLARRARLLAARAGRAVTLADLAEARALLGAERLRLLAQPVPRRVSAEALVLAPALTADLDAVLRRCRRREALWHDLGATLSATASPGVRVLLVGESGTGKTLAASYLATALGAPLYRVDLAAVMNKYIGESEKNLGALLDEAAAHDVVLLFDEADSLFGRRSERKETGERYANMLTNFLLTRIENHPGLAVLTSNSRERIDPAFNRRLDLILEVPLPGFDERLRLWHSHLGARAPAASLCRTLAAHCELAGGAIRNVVLTAATLTDAADGPLDPVALMTALRLEYRKAGRAPPTALTRLAAVGDPPPDGGTP